MATRVIYEGDEVAAHSHLPRAQNLMHKVREFVAASGARVFSQTLVLDESSYAYCLKVGDLETIFIFSQPNVEPPELDIPLIPILPDLYSGVVRDGNIRTDLVPPVPPQTAPVEVRKLEFFKPNAATLKRNKDGKDHLVEGYQAVRKLAVEPNATYFNDYIGGNGSTNPATARRNSQYLNLHPSNYSGKMQKLVQVVLGFGHIPPASVIEKDPKTRATIINYGLQLVYDFRALRTHGVVTAGDGSLWLVEVSTLNGVIAMPLPMFKDSKQKLENSPSSDYQEIVKEFGGLPSGYGFPLPKKLAKAIADGTVIRLASADDMQPFYRLSTYSSACGWAFNESGSEAHNTAWGYGDDGMKRGYHYALDIQIGELVKDRKPGQPIAMGSAILRLAGSGRLFYQSVKSPPPFKYFEPLLAGGGLLSADFLPSGDWTGYTNPNEPLYLCDCPMFVYFADDQLKVVNYFYDRNSSSETIIEDNYEQCMYVGAWQRITSEGVRRIPMMFYTTDYDDRMELPLSRTTENYVGADVGYYAGFTDQAERPEYCDYWRQKWFRETGVIKYEGGISLSNAVIIPFGLRNGYVYATSRGTTSTVTTKQVTYSSLTDPNSYEGFRSLFDTPPKNTCFLRDVRKVQTAFYDKSNQCALDLADNGAWAQVCDTIPLNSPAFPFTSTSSTSSTAATETLTGMLNTGTSFGNIKLTIPPGTWWMYQDKSPNSDGDVQFMACMHSADIGAPQIYYSLHLNPDGTQYAALGTMMADAVADVSAGRAYMYNFVGVP